MSAPKENANDVQPNKPNSKIETNDNHSKTNVNTMYEYSFIVRFIISLLALANHVLFILLILFYFNFHLDSKKYNLDYFGITRLSKNPHFTLCSVIDCRFSPFWLCSVNVIILIVLFTQEVIFTNKNIKSIFIKRCPSDFIYFPKLISRFISSLSLIMSLMLYQPTKYKWSFHLDFSKYIRPIWFTFPFLIGLIQCLKSVIYLIGWNDKLCTKVMWNAIVGKGIPKLGEYIHGDGIYLKMRSPFRGGVIIMAFFINMKWDIGRVIYYLLFYFCLDVEAVNEDRYYFEKHQSYRKYMKEVKNLFFNVDSILNKPKQKIIKTE